MLAVLGLGFRVQGFGSGSFVSLDVIQRVEGLLFILQRSPAWGVRGFGTTSLGSLVYGFGIFGEQGGEGTGPTSPTILNP